MIHPSEVSVLVTPRRNGLYYVSLVDCESLRPVENIGFAEYMRGVRIPPSSYKWAVTEPTRIILNTSNGQGSEDVPAEIRIAGLRLLREYFDETRMILEGGVALV